MKNNNIPTVRGFVVGNFFKFYCPFCDTFHTHGWGQSCENERSHRCAHCGNRKNGEYYESPFSETGYYIKLFTKPQTKKLSGYADKNLKHIERRK